MTVVVDGTSGITTNSGTVVSTTDATLNGLTVGKGGGAISSNTAVGSGVLGAITTGTENAGLGYQALYSATSGAALSALGRYALRLTTTGTDSTAVGDGALQNNTTGSFSTAVGSQALASNTTGYYQTAVGYQAGYSNTSGDVTAVGYQALKANTSGGSNTAMGFQSLQSNTTGAQNTGVGYLAGYSGTTGSANTFIGDESGYSKTTGDSNTFVGAASGYNVSTGAKNTIIGRYNGNQGSLDIRTSSNYIVLSDGDGNPRATCNDAGRWLIGGFTVVDSARISVSFDSANSTGVSYKALAGAGGTVSTIWNSSNSTVGSITTTGSATAFNTTSDYRLKNTITPMTGALIKVLQLKPVTYKWNRDGANGQGFIAHELQAVVPDCVTGEKDAVDSEGNPKYQQVDTSFLIGTLTAAIQELKTIVDAQASEITALKAKVGI
jgi:hypothetical protein